MTLSATLGYRALFAWNTPALFLSSLVVTPCLQIVFFATLGAGLGYRDPSFFILGNAVQVSAAAGIAGLVSVIADERRFGTLTTILASPAPRVPILLGRLLPGAVLGTAVSAIATGIGLLAVGAPLLPEALAVVMGSVVASAASSSTLGLFLSAIGLVYRDVFQLAGLTSLVLLVVSGANVAPADLPLPLRMLGSVLPQSHAVAAVRLVSEGDAAQGWVWTCGEAVVGICWLLGALLLMRIMETMARRHATIDLQ